MADLVTAKPGKLIKAINDVGAAHDAIQQSIADHVAEHANRLAKMRAAHALAHEVRKGVERHNAARS